MITFHKGEIPFALLLIPFVAGLCLDMVFPCTSILHWVWLCMGLLFVIFTTLGMFYQQWQLYKLKLIGGISVWLILFSAGIIAFNNNRQINRTDHLSKKKGAYLIGNVASEPKLNAGILRFKLKAVQVGDTKHLEIASGNLIVSVKVDTGKKTMPLLYGDQLLVPAKFTDVESPANPAEFNYKAYLAHQNIYQQTFLIQHELAVLSHDNGNPLILNALKLRSALVTKLHTHMADSDAIAVASTIVLGYRADLRKEVQEAYTKTGTMHLLSVAGMHAGLIYFLITFLLSFLPHGRYSKLIKAILSITIIWCYALITGFSPAVSRAALMLTMVIMGATYNRHINKLNLLAVSAFILLLYNPFYITDAGFQLSYIAVFGIIIIQPYIYKWFNPGNKLLREVWLVGSVSISAQIILLPVAAFYFHDFPVYFLLSNIFIILPSAIVMYAGIFYLMLPNIPHVSAALGWLVDKTIVFMTKTLLLIEQAPYGNIDKIWLTTTELLLGYALIFSLLCSFTLKNKQWLKVSLLVLLLLSVSISIKTYRANTTCTLTFFSLRKNSGILFRNGRSAVLMTNLADTDKTWRYSIQPYLDSCKINKLSVIPVTCKLQANYLAIENGLLTFDNHGIFVISRKNSQQRLSQKLNTDYIYLTENPHVDLDYLKQNYTFKMLIADGTNSTQQIKRMEKETSISNISFLNLKRNKSLTIVSNQ